MTEIVGEAAKTGLAIALAQKFPGDAVYTEQQTNGKLMKFPQFFIEQLTMSVREERKGYWWLNCLVTARWRVSAEPFAVPDLQKRLDDVSLKLMEIGMIDIASMPTHVKNARTEKADGVLHYFCGVSIQANKERAEEINMWTIEQNNIIQKRKE